MIMDRVKIIINLSAIKRNIKSLQSNNPSSKIMAIMKADGYGLGSEAISRSIDDEVDYFGVATIEEGILLRKNGIKSNILILGYIPKDKLYNLKEYDLMATVYSNESFYDILQYGGKECKVHIAINTGMNRLGFRYENFNEILEIFKYQEYLNIQGIFTHLTCADTDKEFTLTQLRRFKNLIDLLDVNNVDFGLTHAFNSAASINTFNNYFSFDMIRVGYALYGYSDELETPIKILSRIIQINRVKKGESIGYGKSYVATEDKVIAVVSAGYADGFPHLLSNRGRVTVKGVSVNIVGDICMDYFMVDISDISAKVGDEVILFGEDINWKTFINDYKIFPYEFLCNICHRGRKLYIEN